MTDQTTPAAPPAADPPPSAEQALAEPATAMVEHPIGQEFPLTAHESIAQRLGAEMHEIVFVIETDVKAGIHRLKGWLKV